MRKYVPWKISYWRKLTRYVLAQHILSSLQEFDCKKEYFTYFYGNKTAPWLSSSFFWRRWSAINFPRKWSLEGISQLSLKITLPRNSFSNLQNIELAEKMKQNWSWLTMKKSLKLYQREKDNAHFCKKLFFLNISITFIQYY
jgi:hypothetical protein